MVDIGEYVPMFTEAELEDIGINEKVRFTVLQEVLEKCGDDKDALSEELSARCDDLIPKHIIIDDIMASINYLKHQGVVKNNDMERFTAKNKSGPADFQVCKDRTVFQYQP